MFGISIFHFSKPFGQEAGHIYRCQEILKTSLGSTKDFSRFPEIPPKLLTRWVNRKATRVMYFQS